MSVTVVSRTEFVTRISSRASPSPSFPSFLTTWPASAGAGVLVALLQLMVVAVPLDG